MLHTWPQTGLRDNKLLMALLKEMKVLRKPLSESAKTLRELIRDLEDQIKKLHSFVERQVIKLHWGQLEQEVTEAVESGIDHLKVIETTMIKQIGEYRERCFENLQADNNMKQELTALSSEVSEFIARWNGYFSRIEAYERDSAIEADKTAGYLTVMQSTEEKMRKKVLNRETMVFNVNSQFLKE